MILKTHKMDTESICNYVKTCNIESEVLIKSFKDFAEKNNISEYMYSNIIISLITNDNIHKLKKDTIIDIINNTQEIFKSCLSPIKYYRSVLYYYITCEKVDADILDILIETKQGIVKEDLFNNLLYDYISKNDNEQFCIIYIIFTRCILVNNSETVYNHIMKRYFI
ncbi:hypothetical protein BTW14_gp023 [BeAn 58058 virus]|uniref:hypothetical protein n=1 Tax=BeAn 58058 virus TaxID=67082 RepID=UPI00090A30E0|nr:hypothetical protein BTW14_gp023 [BeAn 58058 virus]APG58214.1 hypothetical protein BAV00025 [BeAn 58058 virus]